MSIYKISFSYDGTNFFGWQKQPDQRTIQGEIEKVLQKISKSEQVQVVGCGRTDAGVHAISQITRVTIPIDIGPQELMRGLNSLLPQEIRVNSADYCCADFQPVFDAKLKTYRYVFSLKKEVNPFLKNYVTYLGRELDIELMREAGQLFVGEHDFEGFSTKGTVVKTTVREIVDYKILEEELTFGPGAKETVLVFEITGTGFLKQMVRLVVSAIWSFSEGKINREDIEAQLQSPSASKLAPTAPPNGLYLVNVVY